jgi:thiamine-phosphate pyrophosphorylase
VPFIVNDDLALALECGADGVPSGSRRTADVAAARSRLAGKFLGVSCYDSLAARARRVARGADYVAFGSVFASPTKPSAVRAPLSLFAEARALGVPLVAIGGITLENAPQLLAAGADAWR